MPFWTITPGAGGGGGGGVAEKALRSDVTDTYAYMGVAPLGSVNADPVWLITRITLPTITTGTVTQTATGSWTDRASLTYV